MTIFTRQSEGTGISLDPHDQYAPVRKVLQAEPCWTGSQLAQMLGRVHRPGAQRLAVIEPTIEESHVRSILERKLQALGTVAENPESLLDKLNKLKPEPASVIWGKRTMNRPTIKSLTTELGAARCEIELLRTNYDQLKLKYDQQCHREERLVLVLIIVMLVSIAVTVVQLWLG